MTDHWSHEDPNAMFPPALLAKVKRCVHVTPIRVDLVWCDRCEAWVLTAPPNPAMMTHA